jgi:3-oxoacyl-[acyl-carrier protein] reductase
MKETGSLDLQGRVALVTGSTRRTGHEIARRFAAAGAAVMITGRSSLPQAQSIARDIETEFGVRTAAAVADVTEPDAIERLIAQTVEHLGGLDILVNNAAARQTKALADTSLADWHAVLRTVLDGAFLCAKAAAPHLARSGQGRIINIGGVAAHIGGPRHAAQITAKAGLVGLTRALAFDLGSLGITVNCVAPGTMIAADDSPARAAQLRSYFDPERVPLGRVGSPTEIADAVVSLCGDRWKYMTGQVIHINGGLFFGGA